MDWTWPKYGQSLPSSMTEVIANMITFIIIKSEVDIHNVELKGL